MGPVIEQSMTAVMRRFSATDVGRLFRLHQRADVLPQAAKHLAGKHRSWQLQDWRARKDSNLRPPDS